MILDEYVWTPLSGSNIKYYESLGYNIPKTLVRDGHKNRVTVKRGTKILVDIEDLQYGSKSDVNAVCDYCGEQFIRPYQFIVSGRKNTDKDSCNECKHKKAGESRKLDFNEVVDAFKNKGYTLLTTKDEITFLNTDTLRFMCQKHGEKTTVWNRFQQLAFGCDECGVESNSFKLRQYAWERIIATFTNSEYLLISGFDEYTNARDNCLRCVCTKHGEFRTSLANYQRYSGCPMCNSSAGERSIADYLNKYSIEYEKPKSFNGLVGVGGKKLSYDFYLPYYNMLIEYQGAQHESPGHFSSDINVSEQNFLRQKEHDKRKKEYAIKNGYKFLEIWYYDFYNIDNILNKNLTIQN